MDWERYASEPLACMPNISTRKVFTTNLNICYVSVNLIFHTRSTNSKNENIKIRFKNQYNKIINKLSS